MRRTWRRLLPIAILILLVGYLYAHREGLLTTRPATTAPVTATPNQPATPAPRTSQTSQLPAFLTPEAHHTLVLIARGGPFPYRQDDAVFGNYEHLLPTEPRGYYHEYTVATPGARNRAARRIITGGSPPVVYYYTDDHYRSFRKFTVPR